MACEPPYYELLIIDIICCVVEVFGVIILLFHKCMLPTFEDPQFFKLMCVGRVMWQEKLLFANSLFYCD
jgi:hypothetical protein